MLTGRYGRGAGAERSIKRHAGRFGRTVKHRGGKRKGPENKCVCPKCGYGEPKITGVRCEQVECPECGSILK